MSEYKTKDQINSIREKLAEFKPVMDGLSRARNPFELRYFVIGKHDDRIQQYKQAVIEMDSKYKAIEEAVHKNKLDHIERERLEIQIKENPVNRLEELENAELYLKIEEIDRNEKIAKISMTGAFKEVMDFIAIIENEYMDLVDKTEEELLRYEVDYWKARFSKQIHIDLMTAGKISAGNRTTLESMPQEVQEEILKNSLMRTEEYKLFEERIAKKALIKLAESYPHETSFLAPADYVPLVLRKNAPEGYPENKIVNIDKAEIMVATLHRPGDTVWLSNSFYIPAGKNNISHWLTCPSEELIGDYRNRIVKDALSLGCTHLFFVDDDVLIDNSALQKLYAHDLDVVGGWYCKKTPIPESATLIRDGESKQGVPLTQTGLVEVDWSLTCGLTLYKMDVFKKIPYPWFITSIQGTEDTYFSARARECGIKSFLDTSIQAGHVDKKTGIVYCCDGKIRSKNEYEDYINVSI